MIWVVLAGLAGLFLGAGMARPLLMASSRKAAWTTANVPDLVGAVASGAVVVGAVAALFLCFGTPAGAAGAALGALGGSIWSVARRSKGGPRWLPVAQGASAGIIAVPLLLGLGLGLSSLGDPFTVSPSLWFSLVGDRAYPAWVASVRSGNSGYRSEALQELRRSGSRAKPVFLAALKSEDERVRASAVERLSELGGPGLYELFIPLIEDSSPEVRAKASAALQKLEDPRAVMVLLEAAGKTNEVTDQFNFPVAAAKLPGALPIARSCALGNGECASNENARYGAIQAIRLSTKTQAEDLEPILKAMRDPSPRVRKGALEASESLLREWRGAGGHFYSSLIGTDTMFGTGTSTGFDFDPDELIVAAARLLEDSDAEVRKQASIWVPSLCRGDSNFNNVEGPPAGDPDGRYPGPPKAALTPILLRVLKSSDREAAGAGAVALGYLGDRRAIPVLKEQDAAENMTYNCRYCEALQVLGVGPLAHSTTYPGAAR